MVWKAVARSRVGRIHQSQKLPCQDHCGYHISNDVIVGVVADGAGSAKYSDEGSKLAVKTVLDYFKTINLERGKLSCSRSEEETRELLTKIVEKVIRQLQQTAEEKHCHINDFACTLLVLIATPDWLGAMQVGDGFIVVRSQSSEDYQLLFTPDKGEFVNETTFITSTHALEEMQVKVMSSPRFIAAATDGLEKVAIRFIDWKPFSPFFKPFEEYLQETGDPEQDDQYLLAFLDSERLNARTDDDKTLLLCLWE